MFAPGMLGYNVLAFIGCLASIAILTSQLRQQKLAAVHGVMIPLLVFVASRFSARFLYGVESGQWHDDAGYYFSFGPGHTSQFAGLYPSLAIVFIYALAIRVPFLRLLDLVVPAACAAIAFGRIGCLIAGCCPGFLLPEGWSLPAWIPNSHHFPAALAEGLVAALLALFLLGVPATAFSSGERTGWFFLLHGSARFLFQFIRADSDTISWGPLTSTQVLAIPLIVAGAFLLDRSKATLSPGRALSGDSVSVPARG